ncbi:small subunit processome component 20 homolog [Drosophila sulfurigaster albostrigata]|uniref:small subunit processome component 20 homolog n=1 Tax=Drosophila sulfurigaster albostrigata TaxID=89887 RepID=UPI002D21D21E|nr:small subunit processome component 20 homolog [Drosophila sulfurigaster albostrigata]
MAAITEKSKDTNTFRFKSFTERVNEIDLRHLALYHIGHKNEQLEEVENETYFQQTLQKWNVLNLTEEYNYFSKRCRNIVTLPQLLHQKDFVIDLLLERLATATTLSQQPLLELLYVLARDLREEFYAYFQRVLDRLICLLNTQDAEQLEWTLICLAHLFKTLKSYLKRNIGVVFNAILPLLDEQHYPDHVTNFAVECFAYIARDVRDFPRFLAYVLKTVLREQVESVHGCGRLLYEILRGVNGHLHICAAELVAHVLQVLVNEGASHTNAQTALLSDILQHSLGLLLNFIQVDQSVVLWQQLCGAVAKPELSVTATVQLLELMLPLVTHKDGRYIAELSLLVPTMLKLLDRHMTLTTAEPLQQLSTLVSSLLQARQTQLSQLDASRLLQQQLKVHQVSRVVYVEFILQMLDYKQFELLVLPHVVAHYEEQLDESALELLARIVQHKRPLAVDAQSLSDWQAYVIQLKQSKTMTHVEKQLQNIDINDESQLLLLLLLPHLRGFSKQSLESSLQVAIEQQLTSTSSYDSQLLLLLLQTHALLKFKLAKKVRHQLQQTLLPSIASDPRALACLQLMLLKTSKGELDANDVDAILEPVSQLLSQSAAQCRRMAAHCLQLLGALRVKNNPYEYFAGACSIELTVHNYRELLLQLQQLEPAAAQFKQYAQLPHFKEHAVSLLLGLLYNNFKFVWAPVQQLLAEYLKVMTNDEFWTLFKAKLLQTNEYIDYTKETTTLAQPKQRDYNSSALGSLLPLEESQQQITLQQALNYRQLLWQCIPKLGSIAEVKNADLVRLFLQFVEREYRGQLEHAEYTWNLQETAADDIEVDEEPEESTPAKGRQKRRTRNLHAKFILQTLQLKLSCFVAQPNPKALHREPEMREFYLELLAGPNAQLQQLALDCLVAYKQPAALVQHKEQLSGLVDEAKFKASLTGFELSSLAAQQRTELMPYMLRLLYGHLNKGNQRQLSGQQRKTLILRFLGQLDEQEILGFLRMAFSRFENYTNQPVELLVEFVRKEFVATSVIAARQLQRIVNLLELIRKEFAGRLSADFQVYVLKLLLLAGGVSQQALSSHGAAGKLLNAYRNVRHAALQTLVSYFDQLLDNAELWQESQLSAICEVFVWPNLARLPQESIHAPTPLLKLLLLWGSEPRFHSWLQERSPTDADAPTIMKQLMALLLNDKAKHLVRRPLLQLVEQLLECANSKEKEDDQAQGALALAILQPYIPDVLQLMQASWKQKKSGKQSLDKRELNILSLLTVHVQQPETCETLLQLLLPIFIKQAANANASPETVLQLIQTLANLSQRVPAPHQYVRQLAPLFEQVHALPARKLLCELLAEMAKRLHKQAKLEQQLQPAAEQLREWARIVLLLNAWDKRWLEQPDYDKRLQALNELKQQLEQPKEQVVIDLELGLLVTYNCFYMLRHVSDLGMRVNIGELLKLLLPHLTRQLKQEQLHHWLEDCLLPLLQRCLRDERHEHARSEAIGLLGELARQCPQVHDVLRDLAPLTDQHDLEVDFFENMLHLQTQRHGRGLQRLVNIAGGASWRATPPCARSLTQFLLPLATRYLLSEKHSGKHTLVDAAIEAVGVMCELLPWQHYQAVLRHYLQRLRHSHSQQKQCVRLVVRVLDAFHFDLSNAHADVAALAQLKQKLSESVVEEQPKEEEVEKTEGEPEEKPVKEEDGEIDFEADKVEEEETETETEQPKQRQDKTLAPNAAKRVMATITSVLLPTLNRAITEKTNYDTKHKVNRRRLSYEREEEEIQRVPIALAMVKLLQKLPQELLDNSLPGIFMKVCTFLRSPLKSVRMLTRDILKKIMLTLGGSCLGLLLEQLQSLLTRGFQVHVLSVTLHGVLDALRGQLQPTHIESCLQNLLEVALNDIFGDVNAEKEVDKIVAHTPEAKPSAKSYLTLNIAARHIRDNCLLDLLLPFKEQLARTHSRKVTQKIQECFAKIVAGLVENTHIARESLLIFIYGTMSESITDLLPGTQKRQLSAKEQALMRRARPDCLLLQPAPGRRSVTTGNKQVKSSAQANAHILIEFGLELLHFVLKRKKLTDLDYQPFLHPLLPLLRDALSSNHARTTSYALKCYTAIWLGEYELAELNAEQLAPVVKRMFDILKNFSTFGATRQEENAQLVRASFKAVVALLRKCEDYALTAEQIEQLLLHIEQELQEGECSSQTMCFTLLKALVGRKVDTRSLHDLMKRLGDLSIISQSDHVRDESRSILITYIMEYPLQQRVEQLMKFMSVQLAYTQPSGRQSAIQFMLSIINKFPLQMLAKHSEFLYLSLGTRLVNDEDTACRRAVAAALEALLGRLNKLQRQPLLDLTLLFFTSPQSSQKPGVREMAAAMLSRFVQAERGGFVERLPLVLPTLVAILTLGDVNAGGKFVRAPGREAFSAMDSSVPRKRRRKMAAEEELLADMDPEARLEHQQRCIDHQLIQLQYCLLKIFEHCGEVMLSSEEFAPTVDELAYACQRLLAHEHNWVRCNAAKLLTQILAHYDYDYVGQQLVGVKREHKAEAKSLEFIYAQPAQDLKSLVLDLCAQVTPGETAQEMIDELVKILLYVAHMLRDVPFSIKQEPDADADQSDLPPAGKINLNWLVRNIRFLINKELAKAPHDTSIRTALFTLIEGLSTLLSVDVVTQLAPPLLQSLVREMSEEDQNVDAELRQLALRVGSRLRKRIGTETYDKLRNVVQTKLMVRRAERRKAVAQEKIHDPERAAKRKAGVQERKKAAKRLKTAVVRGKAPDMKQKLKKRKRKAEMEGF